MSRRKLRPLPPDVPDGVALKVLKALFRMLEKHPDEVVRSVYTDQICPLLEGKHLDPNIDWPNPHIYFYDEHRFVSVIEILSQAGKWSAAQAKAAKSGIGHQKKGKKAS